MGCTIIVVQKGNVRETRKKMGDRKIGRLLFMRENHRRVRGDRVERRSLHRRGGRPQKRPGAKEKKKNVTVKNHFFISRNSSKIVFYQDDVHCC